MACIKQYFYRSQSAQVIFHLELWWSKACLGQLNYPFLLMVENLLIEVGAPGTDFTKPCFNHLAKREGFQFKGDSLEGDFELVHQMSDVIELCCRSDLRILSMRVGYVKRNIDITKTENHELDKDVYSGMMAGLTDDNILQDVNIMGAIFNQPF